MSAAIDQISEFPVSQGVWSVDPALSEISFAVKAMYGLLTVRGAFGACEGSLTVRTDGVAGELTIDTDSLDTGNHKRDRHLRSSDFFDAERYPRIVFATTAVSERDRGLTLTGDLTIGSECRQLEIPVEVEQTAEGVIALDARTTISRAAMGIGWNWLGTIGDDTRLCAQLTLRRAAG